MPQKQQKHPEFSRRSLLKLGFLGATLVGGAALFGQYHGRNAVAASESELGIHDASHSFLLPHEVAILMAVAPVVIADNFPQSPTHRQAVLRKMLTATDQFFMTTSAVTQKNVHGLFKLLDYSVFRWLSGGMWTSWDQASEQEIRAFLHRWRDSRFNTLRQGYVLLIQIPHATFYAEPDNWTDEIYPGPPKHIPTPIRGLGSEKG